MYTILMLIASNIFMTFAWYGHVWFFEGRAKPALWLTVVICWLVAFPEYALQVPANREGAKTFTTAQLKIIQEVIAVAIFLVLNFAVGKKLPTWNEWAAFALIIGAVLLARLPGTVASS